MQIIIINRQKKIPISKRAIKITALKALGIISSVKNNTRLTGKSKVSNGRKTVLPGKLNIVFVDNRTIQELNFKFLGKLQPTDVLSFDLSFGGRFAADIVISAEKACENSGLFKTSPFWEMRLYLIHGILHLFGYRDRRKKDKIRMHRKALEILSQI